MKKDCGPANPGKYVEIIYAGRFRRAEDKLRVLDLYRQTFEPQYPLHPTTGLIREAGNKNTVSYFNNIFDTPTKYSY